jgi:hypothetical protein
MEGFENPQDEGPGIFEDLTSGVARGRHLFFAFPFCLLEGQHVPHRDVPTIKGPRAIEVSFLGGFKMLMRTGDRRGKEGPIVMIGMTRGDRCTVNATAERGSSKRRLIARSSERALYKIRALHFIHYACTAHPNS